MCNTEQYLLHNNLHTWYKTYGNSSIKKLNNYDMFKEYYNDAPNDVILYLCIKFSRYIEHLSEWYHNINSELEIEDLIQVGIIGLLKAIKEYNWEKGYDFNPKYEIMNEVNRYIQKTSYIVYMPLEISNILWRISKDEYKHDTNANTALIETNEYIARLLKMPTEKIASLRQYRDNILNKEYLDERISESSELMKVDLLEDGTNTEKEACIHFVQEGIYKALETLDIKEQIIITLYFGLLGNKEMSFADIGAFMGFSGTTISSYYKKALRKLRHPYRRYLLGGYVKHYPLLEKNVFNNTSKDNPYLFIDNVVATINKYNLKHHIDDVDYKNTLDNKSLIKTPARLNPRATDKAIKIINCYSPFQPIKIVKLFIRNINKSDRMYIKICCGVPGIVKAKFTILQIPISLQKKRENGTATTFDVSIPNSKYVFYYLMQCKNINCKFKAIFQKVWFDNGTVWENVNFNDILAREK